MCGAMLIIRRSVLPVRDPWMNLARLAYINKRLGPEGFISFFMNSFAVNKTYLTP